MAFLELLWEIRFGNPPLRGGTDFKTKRKNRWSGQQVGQRGARGRTFGDVEPALSEGCAQVAPGPRAPRASRRGARQPPASPREGERTLSAPAREEGGQEARPGWGEKGSGSQPPRPAGRGRERRMRRARPPIPPAREGGPRRPELPPRDLSAHRGAAGRAGLRRRRPRQSAGRRGEGPTADRHPRARRLARGGARRPQSPRRERMRECGPGSRAGCGSRTKAGRRGRSWGRRAGGRRRSPRLVRASGAGNFLCDFGRDQNPAELLHSEIAAGAAGTGEGAPQPPGPEATASLAERGWRERADLEIPAHGSAGR